MPSTGNFNADQNVASPVIGVAIGFSVLALVLMVLVVVVLAFGPRKLFVYLLRNRRAVAPEVDVEKVMVVLFDHGGHEWEDIPLPSPALLACHASR